MPKFRSLPSGFECGPYKIVKEIGRGGMAIVYVAESPDGKCAIKTLQFNRSLQPRQVKRFHREIHVVASINHMNVVRFYDAGRVVDGETGSLMWMAQEYVDGVTLREVIYRSGGRVPVRDVANWCEQIAGGVAAAHGVGVVHRDLKPENVMLVDAAKVIKVIDFNISKFRQWGTTTTGHRRDAVGTMGYMAPEQLDGDAADIDERTDVYALGLILFELATGHSALAPDGQQLTVSETIARTCTYDPPRLDTLIAEFPAELADIAVKALKKRREERFESMTAVREALKTFEASYLLARRQAALQATDWGLPSVEPHAMAAAQDASGGWAPGQKRTVKLATPEEALQHVAAKQYAVTAPLPAIPSPSEPMPPQLAAPKPVELGAATTRSGGRIALAFNSQEHPRPAKRSWATRVSGVALGSVIGYLASGVVVPLVAPLWSAAPPSASSTGPSRVAPARARKAEPTAVAEHPSSAPTEAQAPVVVPPTASSASEPEPPPPPTPAAPRPPTPPHPPARPKPKTPDFFPDVLP